MYCSRRNSKSDGERFEDIWEFAVETVHVPELVALLGGPDGNELLEVIERYWKPFQIYGLEKRVRLLGKWIQI